MYPSSGTILLSDKSLKNLSVRWDRDKSHKIMRCADHIGIVDISVLEQQILERAYHVRLHLDIQIAKTTDCRARLFMLMC